MLQISAAPTVAPASEADDVADTVHRIEITIQNRKVVRDNNVIRITQGEEVELVWSSDETANLHLHGYDIEFKVTPDAPTPITFTAHATGRFPITSHGFGDQHRHGHDTLLYLEVYPK
ncbi:MAG: hypothetical protein ABFS22_13420 [Pseudomonadota bacterium]